MVRVTRSRVTRSAAKRAGNSLLEQIRAKAIERELKRIRKLLELEEDAYSDLFVMQRARQYLAEVMDDDVREEMLEMEELEDDDE